MPYISQLLNNTITDSSDSLVGNLKDILINPKNGNFSPLRFLVVQTNDKKSKFVSYDFVENFTSSSISLKNTFDRIALSELPKESFVHLKKEVLDRQIVDISGTRVVRVDDLRIGNFDGKMCVLGIDTSFQGLLRRAGLDIPFMNKIFKARFLDWREVQLLDNGPLQMNGMAENFKRLHPADLANIVEDLDIKRGSTLLGSLDDREAAKVMEELDTAKQNVLAKYLGPEKAGKILAQMSSDEVVDLVKTFSDDEATQYLSQVNGGKIKTIEKMTEYPDNTAGGLMTLEYIAVGPEWTVAQAISEIKNQTTNFRSIFFIYVIDDERNFIGVVSMRRLLTEDHNVLMKDLAKSFSRPSILHPDDKINKIIEVMTRYNLYTAAVMDENKKMVGVVTIDDVMRQLFPAA